MHSKIECRQVEQIIFLLFTLEYCELIIENIQITFLSLPQRLIDEFAANESVISELKQEADAYQQRGKVEAAHRLREQVNLLETRFTASQAKLNSFTSPVAGFESRLNRAMGALRAVERNSCILDVASASPNNVQDQYKHCLKMYRTLSEIKGEVEHVIKAGRKICEDKTLKHSKRLTQSIDALKHLYNSLGEHVTQSKIHLEKLLRLTNALQSSFGVIEKWLDYATEPKEIAAENVKKRPQTNDSTQSLTNDQIGAMLEKCNELYGEYREICDASFLEELQAKIDGLSERFVKITVNDVGKDLLEIKSTLQNLDNISVDTLRFVRLN